MVEILIVDDKLYVGEAIRERDSTIVRFFNVSIPELQPTPIPKVRAETVICSSRNPFNGLLTIVARRR